MNIYVGNLSWNTNDDELRGAFEAFGEVSSAKVIMDRETGRSRGFGFVEMPDDSAAKEAIEGMNNKDLGGRTLRVNEARPRDDRPRGPRRFSERPFAKNKKSRLIGRLFFGSSHFTGKRGFDFEEEVVGVTKAIGLAFDDFNAVVHAFEHAGIHRVHRTGDDAFNVS